MSSCDLASPPDNVAESACEVDVQASAPDAATPLQTTTIINETIHYRTSIIKNTARNKSIFRIVSQSSDLQGQENFPMGCSFSPDGTCVLTATASDGKLRLYDTPFQHLNGQLFDECCDHNGHHQQDENISAKSPQHEQHVEINLIENTANYSHNQNYNPPSQLHNSNQHQTKQTKMIPTYPCEWKASLTSHQGGPPPPSPASYAWYPLMNSSSPLTSIYLSCRGHSLPIHLIDAYNSQLRASYRPYNAVDELEGPTVVDFSPDGSRIYATGFKTDRTVAVFDTNIPGREGVIMRLGKTRRSSDGQKGIPSAIAFPKNGTSGGDSSSGPSNVFAVGAYSPASIYIYDDRMASDSRPAGTIVLHGGLSVVGHGRAFSRKKRRFASMDNNGNNSGNEDEGNLFSTARVNWFQSRARGGVTQLMWAPPTSSNPYVLYSASRRSNAVLSWDVRALSGQDLHGGGKKGRGPTRPICGLQSYARDGDTNQRLEFDLDGSGNRIFVGSGDKESLLKIYDVKTGGMMDELDFTNDDFAGEKKQAVNGISYFESPYLNGADGLLAVAAGSRQFDEPEFDEEESTVTSSSQNQLGHYLRMYAVRNKDRSQ